ncbi:AAA family ATPase [Lichenicola cladoniae]|uniref:AAA family ATPase n=1 Tax=Lichenicola cladoniae TaxID=1484109 RepID=A0A6M8HUP0_9PROT|nr:AAA family ATPase [Lichenicola cladoniae]NPD66093.1 AAA family ATPase [Acetobacteraceae bacterium]QKE91966.1 AAA family ATPase [Lichenicola cladoniae]
MKLRAIELDQFRKFDRRVRVDGLGDGVNVLCGPNEHGKSTVLAALRAVLFDRHGSRTETIRGYQNHRGNTAPSVALEFEHEGGAHRIEKRFLSRPSARMVSDGTAYEGDAAEERLARLLGVSVVSRAAKDAAQTASIWGALLVAQGESFAQARLGEGARTTLSECLEAELGSVSGGAVIGRLLKQVQPPIAALLDGHGKPRDRYKATIADRDAAIAAIALLQDRRRVLEDDLAAALTARRELARDEDPAIAEHAAEALAVARRHRDAVLGTRARLEQAEAAVALSVSAHAEAVAAQERRVLRATRLAETGRALAKLATDETEARARAQAAQAALEGRREAYDEAGRRHEAAERTLRKAVAAFEAAGRSDVRNAAASRLALAEIEAARVDELSAALRHLRLDENGMRGLQDAALAHRGNEAALLAQATSVELSLDIGAQLLVEGEPPRTLAPGDARLSLTRPAELVIPGAGRMRIVPAARDQERLHAAAQDTARALRRGLEGFGLETMAQAEQAMSRRRDVSAALDQAQRALGECLAGAVPVGPGSKARPDIETLRRHVAMLDADVSERLASLGTERAPDLAIALSDRDAALLLEEQARQASVVARDALLSPDAARDIADAALKQAEFARRDQELENQRLSAEQARDEAAEPLDTLALRLQLTAETVSARRTELASVAASAPEGTPEMADSAIRRLEEAQSNRRTRIGTLRVDIARLESRIVAEEGIGLDEQIEAATRQRETAAREHDAFRREAAILMLLRDTLNQADREARARTLAPLMTWLSPYLQALFPRARLSLGEDFLITGLSRLDAIGAEEADGEAFDALSHGTREQIAILSRLAFADMLLAAGKPAFLVLDDALAFADPVRMERMFDILADAGRRMQILVLTCREDVAAGLGGTRVRLESV